MSNSIRAAAAQFHVGNDLATNLDTCVRIIREAAKNKPDLLVLPEFANHCSWYNDAAHCFAVSVDLDGKFLQTIAAVVRETAAFTVINCTVRRDNDKVTGTSIMFSPEGEIIGTTNKQVLIGHENDFLERATEAGPVVDTEIGKLAMYSCMDGVINETPRCLALRGAEVLCNSLNSFAIDEGSLHIPVRAAENKVWVVAANKIGPLIPAELVAPVSEATNIPAHFLDGAGDSQIVAPDGTVLAMAGKDEEIIVADIEVSRANDKRRPDGTDIFAARNSSLYQALANDPADHDLPQTTGVAEVSAARISLRQCGPDAATEISRQVAKAQAGGAKLICLPALPGSTGIDDASAASDVAVAIAAQLQADTYVATSMAVDNGAAHRAVLISDSGIVLEQPMLHTLKRYDWSATSNALNSLDTDFGKVGVLCGDDAIFPELFRLFAMQGVNILLVPADFAEAWEAETGLVERAAENRINIVAASHARSAATGLIACLQRDFTIMTPWEERQFDGLLSAPVVRRSDDDVLFGNIHPLAAANKECSRNTHLVNSRPWWLLDPITATQ